MKILFIISTILFYISYGITFIIDKKRGSYAQRNSNLTSISVFLCHVLPVISLCYLFDISWYWLAIINFAVCLILPYPLALIYCFIFGIRTKPQFNYDSREFGRQNLYEYDNLLTLTIAIVLFVIALFL